MIGLFFEVQTRPGHRDQYLQLAASLKPSLEAMGGCLFIDRFRSLTREDLLLSYQIWQDEGALTAWRAHAYHHEVQTIGREKVFSDYRIRVAQLIHEARPGQPIWQPERRTPYNDPARRQPTYVLAVESKSAELPVQTQWRHDSFESVYRDGSNAGRWFLSLAPGSVRYLFLGGEWHWEIIVTASVITTVPMIILFFLGQRHFVRGSRRPAPRADDREA